MAHFHWLLNPAPRIRGQSRRWLTGSCLIVGLSSVLLWDLGLFSLPYRAPRVLDATHTTAAFHAMAASTAAALVSCVTWTAYW